MVVFLRIWGQILILCRSLVTQKIFPWTFSPRNFWQFFYSSGQILSIKIQATSEPETRATLDRQFCSCIPPAWDRIYCSKKFPGICSTFSFFLSVYNPFISTFLNSSNLLGRRNWNICWKLLVNPSAACSLSASCEQDSKIISQIQN